MAFLKIFKSKELTDEELIGRYKETNELKIVGELYQRYTHIAFAICMKYLKNEEDSKDAVMQIFEKLFQDLLKHDVIHFQAWFHTLIRNFCLMQLRSKKSSLEYQDNISTKKNVENSNNIHLDERELLEKDLTKRENALEHLKEDQKVCINLFFLKEKSYKEIEEETKYTHKEIKSHIQNGKRNLKIILEKNA